MPRVLALGDCTPLVERLLGSGFEVMRAPGTTLALGLAKDLHPELILVGEGRDLAASTGIVATLSRDALTRFLPILLVVETASPEVIRAGLDAGAADVLGRGIDPIEGTARVDSALRAKRTFDELIADKQKTAVLELAGAVAHKLNQPLTGVSVIVETLIAAHSREDLSRERLGTKLLELERLIGRMAGIVKRISSVADYKTVEYLGDVRILDLEDSTEGVRKVSDDKLRRPR